MGLRRQLPGLVALALGAVLARSIAAYAGPNHLLVAIAIGALVANAAGVPDRLEPGVSTYELWLGAGIVLMGATVTVETIFTVGGRVLLLLVTVTAATILVVELLARNVFEVADQLGSLLAAGAGICGVSAIAAVGGAIRAGESPVAYAAATVLLFDAVTIVVYPILGDLLGLSGVVFGAWAGISMFSTGPVVAVGFAHSEAAGQWATMTKLARNALIGIVVVGYAAYYARRKRVRTDVGGAGGDDGGDNSSGDGPGGDDSGGHDPGDDGDAGAADREQDRVATGPARLRSLWREFPKFVLGFLALAGVASLGLLSPSQQASIENAYSWLFLVAFVGLGTEIRLRELRRTGPTPVLVVLAALALASALSLVGLLVLL